MKSVNRFRRRLLCSEQQQCMSCSPSATADFVVQNKVDRKIILSNEFPAKLTFSTSNFEYFFRILLIGSSFLSPEKIALRKQYGSRKTDSDFWYLSAYQTKLHLKQKSSISHFIFKLRHFLDDDDKELKVLSSEAGR